MAGLHHYPPNYNLRRDQSLDEFEQFETFLKMQSQNSEEGNWMETLREQGVLCDGEFDDEDEDNNLPLDSQRHLQLNTSEEDALAKQGVLFSTDDLTTDDQRDMSERQSNFHNNHKYHGRDKFEDNNVLDEFLHKSTSPYSIEQEEEPELSYLDDDDYEGSIPSDQTDNRLEDQNSEEFNSDSERKHDDGDENHKRIILNHHNTLARTIHAGVSPHPDSFTRDSDPIPFSRSQSIRSSLRSLHSEESGSVALDKYLDPQLERTIQEVASQVESFASPRHSSADGHAYMTSENEMDTTGQVTSYMTEEVNDVEVNDPYSSQRMRQMWKEDSAVESYGSDTGPVSESANMNLGNFVPNAVLRNRPPKPSAIKLKKKVPNNHSLAQPIKAFTVKPEEASNNGADEVSERKQKIVEEEEFMSSNGHKKKSPRIISLSTLSIDSNLPADELVHQLKHEKSSRKQNDELVDRLQQDYDDLLQKYALAEVTIDQLRLGAKINLYSDPETPRTKSRNTTPRANHQQTIHLPQPQRAAALSTDASQNISRRSENNHMLSPYETPPPNLLSGHASEETERSAPDDVNKRKRLMSENAIGRVQGASSSQQEDTSSFPEFTGSEGIVIGLQFQTNGLREQVEVFESQLSNNELQPSEQDQILSKLRGDHERLEQDYMQAKEEHQARCRREGNLSNEKFDPDRELEGEVFQLGMKLDDINETVEENLRNQRPETPPTRRDFIPEHSIEDEIERRRQNMDQEYNSLMDRYDQLKKSTYFPNRDQEVEELVLKLENLHHQDPSRYPLKPQVGEKTSTIPGQFLSASHQGVTSPASSNKGDISFSSTPGKTPDSSKVTPKKGSSATKIPRWNSNMNHEGSISESTASPDTVRRNITNEFHKNGPGKSVLPRPRSQDSQETGSRQKSPELDRDSGFMGSESSRQSQLTNHSGVGIVTLNGPGKTGVLQPESETTLPTRTRRLSFQRQPSYDSYDGPMNLHFESDAEDESVQSEQTTVRYQPPQRDHRKTAPNNGHISAIPSQPQKHQKQQKDTTYQDYLTPQPSDCLPHSTSPSYATVNKTKVVPDTRHTQPERLKARYRRDNDSHSGTSPVIHNGFHNDSVYPTRLIKSDVEHLPQEDSISNATRSSVKSSKLKALQEEIDQLKDRLSENAHSRGHDRRTHMTPQHPKEFSRRRTKVLSDSASDTSSIKSEVLHSLQNEVRELKSKLAVQENAPQDHGWPSSGNDFRMTLREKYIPNLTSRDDGSMGRVSKPNNKRTRSGSSDVGDIFTSMSDSRRSPLRVNRGNVARTREPNTSVCTFCQGSGVCSHDDQTFQPSQNEYYPQSPQRHQSNSYSLGTHRRRARGSAVSNPQHTASFTVQPSQQSYSPQPQYMSTPVAHTDPQYMSTPLVHTAPQFMSTPVAQTTPQFMTTPVTPVAHSPSQQYAPQYISTPFQQTYTPPPQNYSSPQQRMTVREYIPTPVHALPTKTDARFYARGQEKRSRSHTSSEEEEFYYRRSPHSKSRNPKSSYVKRDYAKISSLKSDANLEAAIRVAQHLKSTSKRMLSSVQHDLNNSLSLRDILA
ncbi:uncharacterized protein [Antedon mediterranea]|uniref:uncharacterized protein n=1 Tax=Antedon mediterranea TaxID=105859 RepID=UPI003AF626F3